MNNKNIDDVHSYSVTDVGYYLWLFLILSDFV
jgi:hypothetical protein